MKRIIFVRYKHEILLKKYAKPNQKVEVVRYNREFVITVIVITEFDCICNPVLQNQYITEALSTLFLSFLLSNEKSLKNMVSASIVEC